MIVKSTTYKENDTENGIATQNSAPHVGLVLLNCGGTLLVVIVMIHRAHDSLI